MKVKPLWSVIDRTTGKELGQISARDAKHAMSKALATFRGRANFGKGIKVKKAKRSLKQVWI